MRVFALNILSTSQVFNVSSVCCICNLVLYFDDPHTFYTGEPGIPDRFEMPSMRLITNI